MTRKTETVRRWFEIRAVQNRDSGFEKKGATLYLGISDDYPAVMSSPAAAYRWETPPSRANLWKEWNGKPHWNTFDEDSLTAVQVVEITTRLETDIEFV